MYPTVFAIALNHKSQTEHWHDTFLEAPYKALPKKAVWFIKPRNTYNSDGQITLDQGEQYFSGGTIAIVIGKTASRINASDAAQYIKGFALANEISLAESSFYRPAVKAKCRDKSCPVGSMATNVDADNVTIETYINGELKDSYSTADYVRNAGQILEALTDFATLQEGDMVLMGTPQTRVAIQAGDTVEIKASGFETLVTKVN